MSKETFTFTRLFIGSPYWDCEETAMIMCSKYLNEFWNIPGDCKKVEIVLTNKEVSGSYRITMRRHQGTFGNLTDLALNGEHVPSTKYQVKAVRSFIKKHGKCFAHVYIL